METKEEIKKSLCSQAAELLKSRLEAFGIVGKIRVEVKESEGKDEN